MTELQVDHPGFFALLPLALLPLTRGPLDPLGYAWNDMLPADGVSRLFAGSLRSAGIIAFLGLILGLAGLSHGGRIVEKVGEGANIMLVIDRSNSMDHSFAGKAPTGGEESKSRTAERLLSDFVAKRPHDRFGVTAFSTAPLFVQPLTDNREATLAAIQALETPALAYTHVSKGLAMALGLFQESKPSVQGTRIVLLVSDGAAVVDPDSERLLRRGFQEGGVHLYWVFLRTANTPGLFEVPEDPRDDTPQIRPERHLHLFFQSLGVPYRAFEAESPDLLEKAMTEINRLERLPMRYRERTPRRDLSGWCYGIAAAALFGLLAVKLVEVRR